MPGRRRSTIRRTFAMLAAATAVASAAVTIPAGTGTAVADEASSTFTLTPTRGATAAGTSGNNQGFSVESADFAHGFLTQRLLTQPLATLGQRGVLRIGGYTAELVWPAFGAYAGQPAPSWAIGGTVDQSDLDQLKLLLAATSWQVTIAVPVASVLNSRVSYDQAVAEVVAAQRTLGDRLQAVEIGNEYDLVTRLTPAEYYSVMRTYYGDINAVLPDAGIRLDGPSDGTPAILQQFASAAAADPTLSDPRQEIHAVTAHHYDAGRCGLDIPGLMSAQNYTTREATLQGDVAAVSGLHDGMPVVLNETNSMSGSGCTGVSNSYAASLWVLDYLLQATQAGITDLNFHTSTARVCGDYHTDSVGYTTSYRWYAAFCAADQAALDSNELSASPLYYGVWAFRHVPAGQFVELGGYSDDDLSQLRAYGVESPQQSLTMVLINIQDPSSPTSTTDSVKLDLPASYQATGSAVTLQSSAPGGFASTDASAITLGGRRAVFDGTPPGALDHTVVPVDDGAATIDVAPGTAQVVTLPGLKLPGAVDITGITPSGAGPLTSGQPNAVTISVANTTDTAQTVTATLQVPAGWQAGTVTQAIPALSHADLTVPVTPPLAPTQATLTARVSAPQVATYGDPDLDVITTPAGDAVPLALDAGTSTSPVLAGYTRLSPDDIWATGDRFGWVGAAPSSRDRGFPDDLRRDLIASQSPATVRLNVPAGTHEAYLLIGDPSFAANPIIVRSGGQTVASTTTPLPPNQYQWIHFPVDGGTAGQQVDLTFSSGGSPGQYWVFDALVVLP